MKRLLPLLFVSLLLFLNEVSFGYSLRVEVDLMRTRFEEDADFFGIWAMADGSHLLEDLSKNWVYQASLVASYKESLGSQVRPNNLYAKYDSDYFVFVGGYQIISWGESFGINPVDIINPNIADNFFENDSLKSKESAPLINFKVILGNFDLSLIGGVTLTQKVNDSENNLGLNTKKLNGSNVFLEGLSERDTEPLLAARFGGLLSFGLDFTLFAAVHGNRTPKFSYKPSLEEVRFEQITNRNQTVGATYSYPAGKGVIRGEGIFTNTDNNLNYRAGESGVHTLTAGYDQTSTIGDITVLMGLQGLITRTEDISNKVVSYSKLYGIQSVVDSFKYDSGFSLIYLSDIERENTFYLDSSVYYNVNDSNKLMLTYNLVETDEASSFSNDFFSYIVGERDLFRLTYAYYF